MERKNKLVYLLTMLFIIIVFLVIIFFGETEEKIVYVDSLPKQPVNHIRNIIKEEEPPEIDDGKNDDKNNGKNNGKNNNGKGKNDNEQVKPNTESPIKFVFNEDLTKGNYIYLTNQFPTLDEVGRKLSGEYKTFDFKLEFDKEALGASYDITLEKMENSDLENSWVKVYLESDGVALNQSIRDNGRVRTFNDYAQYSSRENEITLFQGTVTSSDIAKGYKDFTLRMWISEDVKIVNEEYNGKTIIARVNVYTIGN